MSTSSCVPDEESSSDELIGAEAEQEYEATLQEEPPAPKAEKRVKLTNLQRLQLIDAYRQGKTDKFYNVIPDKKKPGDYRIVKRRKPLDVPIADSTPPAPSPVVQQPVIEEHKAPRSEFYAMQTTINNSLSKEIAAVMEKCNKIERKMKEQKRKMKEERRKQQEIIEYEYSEGDVQEEPEPQYEIPQYYTSRSPFSVRRRIDIRDF